METENSFDLAVTAFNRLYNLPTPAAPTLLGFVGRGELVRRLSAFKKIMIEELEEVEEIINKIAAGDSDAEVLTEIADWLGDLQVYSASEMRKFGLDNSVVLSTIMASNMSKLGADGQVLKNADGKVLKGPNYWRPEPMLQRYIEAAIRQGAFK